MDAGRCIPNSCRTWPNSPQIGPRQAKSLDIAPGVVETRSMLVDVGPVFVQFGAVLTGDLQLWVERGSKSTGAGGDLARTWRELAQFSSELARSKTVSTEAETISTTDRRPNHRIHVECCQFGSIYAEFGTIPIGTTRHAVVRANMVVDRIFSRVLNSQPSVWTDSPDIARTGPQSGRTQEGDRTDLLAARPVRRLVTVLAALRVLGAVVARLAVHQCR